MADLSFDKQQSIVLLAFHNAAFFETFAADDTYIYISAENAAGDAYVTFVYDFAGARDTSKEKQVSAADFTALQTLLSLHGYNGKGFFWRCAG